MIAQESSETVSETGGMFAWNMRLFPVFWLVITGLSNGREGGKVVVFWVVDKILPKITYPLPLQIVYLLPGVHVMGALAEFERALIRERTHAGLKAARARGRKGGRPSKFTREQERQIAVAMSNRATTMAEIRQLFKVSDTTLRRIAAKYRENEQPAK
jgi:transposase